MNCVFVSFAEVSIEYTKLYNLSSNSGAPHAWWKVALMDINKGGCSIPKVVLRYTCTLSVQTVTGLG